MKKALVASAFALTGLIYACKNPAEDVQIDLKTPSPTSVELRFKPQTGELPQSLAVKITGPDADKVLTALNTKNFRVDEDGLLTLSTGAADAQHPIRFTVVATADNFYEVVQPVELSDNDLRVVPITLLNRQASTPVVQASAQSDASGSLSKTVQVQTPAVGSPVGQVTVTIPQGTQLKDATAQPVDGQLTLTMLPVTGSATSKLPNDGVMNNATTASGEPIESQQLSNVAGAVTLEIHNTDYQTVKTFSKPVRMAFAVDPQTVNPQTNERIKAGDAISLFSYDAATDRWQQEEAGVIERNGATGQLECVADVPHLSTWAAAYTTAICAEGPTFSLKTNFSDYDVPFLCQVVYVDKSGRDQEVVSSFYRELTDGSDISVGNLTKDRLVRLKVYENAADLSKFVASAPTSTCAKGKINFDLRSIKLPSSASVMTFTIQFPCKNVDEKKLPEQTVAQYRETGSAAWQDLITLSRKSIRGDKLQGVSYKVKKGKRYDFRIKLLGFNVDQPNQLIDKNEWLIAVKTDVFCKK